MVFSNKIAASLGNPKHHKRMKEMKEMALLSKNMKEFANPQKKCFKMIKYIVNLVVALSVQIFGLG